MLVEIRSLRLDGKNHHGVVVLTGAVAGEHFDTARKWVESLMRKAYGEVTGSEGVCTLRRLRRCQHCSLRDPPLTGRVSFSRSLVAIPGEALPRKRLRVLVNPHSGPGKARALWTKQVEPIFRSAQCPVNVTCELLSVRV